MSSTRHIPVSIRRSNASVDSNKTSKASSLSSSHHTSCGFNGMRGKLSCQSHFDNSSTNSCGIGRGMFSSYSCSNMYSGGIGYARRMSTGSYPNGSYGGCPPFGHEEGLAEVSTGVSCGMGVHPMACGIIFSSIDEKEVMQNLNDRLACYIDKAQCLEAENAKLKSKISNFYAKQGLIGEWKDYSHNYRQIEELKKQVGGTISQSLFKSSSSSSSTLSHSLSLSLCVCVLCFLHCGWRSYYACKIPKHLDVPKVCHRCSTITAARSSKLDPLEFRVPFRSGKSNKCNSRSCWTTSPIIPCQHSQMCGMVGTEVQKQLEDEQHF